MVQDHPKESPRVSFWAEQPPGRVGVGFPSLAKSATQKGSPKSPLPHSHDYGRDSHKGRVAQVQASGKGSERPQLGKEPTLANTPDLTQQVLLPPKDGVLLVEVSAGAKGDKAEEEDRRVRKSMRAH